MTAIWTGVQLEDYSQLQHTTFTRMQDEVLSLNLVLKVECKALNQTTLNQTVQSQTKACIAKSSCEIGVLLGYYVAESGNSFKAFWDNLSAISSKVNKSKRQNTA
jgi:hypothetical protein